VSSHTGSHCGHGFARAGRQRHKLTGKLTPVTAESFAAWKAARKAMKEQEERELREKKEAAIKAGKALGGIGVWPPGLGYQRCEVPFF